MALQRGLFVPSALGDNGAIGTSSYTYDWARRVVAIGLPAGFSSATPTFAWRLDGLIASRTWGTGAAATFTYDRAKRPTGLTKGSLTETQAFDRDGNVTSEARSFPNVSGDPGTGSQSFQFDDLNRVIQSTGLASGSRTYTYDRSGNRASKTEAGITFTYSHDRTDQLTSVVKTGGTSQSFAYDSFGDLTGDAQTAVSVTTSTYDLAGRLTGLDTGGSATKTTFALDALGRFRTRTVGTTSPAVDTYSYVGAGETVARISTLAGGSTTVTDSLVSPAGERLGA